jgi:PAS domain-containing protein
MNRARKSHLGKFHLEFLSEELERRRLANKRYSLRAFASFLELHPSALSRILNGKQEISNKSCSTIIKRLELNDEDKRKFVASVAEDRRLRNEQNLALVSEVPPTENSIVQTGFLESATRVISALPDPLVIIGPDCSILAFNAAFSPESELLRQFVNANQEVIGRVFESGRPENLRSADNDWLLSPVFNGNEPIFVLVRLGRTTVKSETLYQAALEFAPEYAFVISSEGLILSFNQKFAETLQKLGDTEDQRWINVIHPDYREQMWSEWERALNLGVSFSEQCAFIGRPGYIYTLRAAPIREIVGGPQKWFVTAVAESMMIGIKSE